MFSQNGIRLEGSNPYSFMDSILQHKRIVLLGEQTHGDGATFEERVKIIKYLHENLGYNTIVLESGLYDHYKAFEDYFNKEKNVSVYDNAISPIWSNTESFQNLYDYIEERAKQNDTIKLLGFDNLEGAIFADKFIPDLKELLNKHKLHLEDTIFNELEKGLVLKDLENEIISKSDSTALYEKFEIISDLLNEIKNPSFHEKMVKQTFESQVSAVSFEIKSQQKQQIAVQNPRDEQMAKNLLFLSDLYPNEKFICLGASYHFAKNIRSVKFTKLTEEYLSTMDSLTNGTALESEDYKKGRGYKLLEGAIPMGQLLKTHYEDDLYSIAFSNYEGEYGFVGEESFPILKPPLNSIEKRLVDLGFKNVFLELKNFQSEDYYCSVLGNIPIMANWANIFDGLIFIKTTYPPKLRKYGESTYISKSKTYSYIEGTIMDFETNQEIPNAEISLLGTDKLVLSNNKGKFKLYTPTDKQTGKIVVSAMGFENDTINISNFSDITENPIRIKEKDFGLINLNEVIVSTNYKQYTSEEIITKAVNNLKTNYSQKPYNQQFYYRRLGSEKGKKIKGEEAIIESYNSNGMKASNKPDTKMFGFATNQQTIGVEEMADSKWDRFGDMTFVFNRDLILCKANVLYRTSSYELQEKETTSYNGKKVYKINFENKSPGEYSTSYGRVKSSSGSIYIDPESFAILKYEHCVIQTPYDSKKNPEKTIKSFHNLVFTYKKEGDFYYISHGHIVAKTIAVLKSSPSITQNYYVKTTDLLSTGVNNAEVSIHKKPLYSMTRPKNDKLNKVFWETNSFIVNEIMLEPKLCK